MIAFSTKTKDLLHKLKRYSPDTYYHCLRVMKLTLVMVRYVNREDLRYSPDEIEWICKGAMLHDIGKLRVRNYLLTKNGKLTPEEKEEMALHAAHGGDLLEKTLSEKEADMILNICRGHHRRVADENEGEEQIPLYVQIVSICDAYDALVSERVYHKSFSREKALNMIEGGECGKFTPYMKQCLKTITAGLQERERMGYSA